MTGGPDAPREPGVFRAAGEGDGSSAPRRPLVFGPGHVPDDLGPTVVTVGNFDGVHTGHRAMLARVLAAAEAQGLPAGAVTFAPHPLTVLHPAARLRLLTGLRHKVALLGAAGMRFVHVLPFDRELSERSAESFAEGVLLDDLRAAAVVVGANFRFGHKAVGDVELLTRLATPRGVEVTGVTLEEAGGAAVSSSRIRAALRDGNLDAANAALGRPFALEGYVVHGDARGRQIGVPTANLGVPRRAQVPAPGIYAGWLTPGPADAPAGPPLPAVTSVGTNPTFGGTTVRVEAHLLDVDLDLYGRRVTLIFQHRLRDTWTFPGVDELLAQIRLDIAATRELLGVPTPSPHR